jgi:hypothetical protein
MLVVTCGLLAPAVGAEAQERPSVPVPVTGRMVNVVRADGERLSGELIEADAERVLLWGPSGMRELEYASLAKVEAQRHGFGSKTALTWVGLGALATGIGMTAACSQVEGTSCGGVFLGVSLSWALFGGLFAAGVASGQYQDVPALEATLRPLTRFPQGAPEAFVETNRSVARPPR